MISLPKLSRPKQILLDFFLVFLFTAVLIRPYFKVKYTDKWASIESTFIADARFLSDHWPHPQWQPLWYAGTRFDYIYPPALRYGTAAISKLTHFWPVKAYHFYTALLYAIGIAGVYLLMRVGTNSRGWAFLAAVATSLMSPIFLFMPRFRLDSPLMHPQRLGVLVRYGEGPHMSALALIPIALAFTWLALEKPRPWAIAAAALFSAGVVSNNFYGATALATLYPLLIWSFWITRKDRRIALPACAIPVLAYGLTAFWLVPSYFRVTTQNMKYVSRHGNVWSLWVAVVVAVAFAVTTIKLARSKTARTWEVFLAGSVVFFTLNVLGNYYFNFRVAGEPGRLLPELDMIYIMAIVYFLRWMWNRPQLVWRGAVVVLVAAAFWTTQEYLSSAWEMVPPWPDHTNRVEYRVTDWLWKNMPDARTYPTGSVRFWFDTWHDLAQLGGGSEQGLLNSQVETAQWETNLGPNPKPAILWMQAMGVEAIYVADKQSQEVFKDAKFPHKLDGVLTVLFDDKQGNVLYKVPRRWPDRIRVVETAKLNAVKPPRFNDDMEYLEAYADAIEKGPDAPATLRRAGTDAMRAHANVGPGQSVLVQETYDPAWHAWSGGTPLVVRKDAMDMMVIDAAPGDHEISIAFLTPLENKVGRVLTLLTLMGILALFWIGIRRERTGMIPEAPAADTRIELRHLGMWGSRFRLPTVDSIKGWLAEALAPPTALFRKGPATYRDYTKTLGCAALLFLFNAYITPLLFRTAYANEMPSIDAAFISLARYVSQHWNDMGWFPLWYGGIPYADSYPPLLHWVSGLVVTLAGVSPGLAYHFVTAMIYCLGPVTLFWMAWRLSGKRECALVAGMGYSLISPTLLLAASARVDADGFWGPRRLVTLVVWGEGPHQASMCLLPLAIGLLHVALEKRKPWYWVAAALSIAAVPMSNWLGGMALAICVVAYLFAGLPAGGKTVRTLLCAGALGVYAYAIAVPWLSPATIAVIRANAPRVADNFQADWTQRKFAIAVAAAFLLAAWAMARWNVPRHTRFACLASLILFSSTMGRLWFRLSLLPQPDRYALEMDMFLWLAVVFAVWPLLHRVFAWWGRLQPANARLRALLFSPSHVAIRATTGVPPWGREWLLPRLPAVAIVLLLAVACVPIVKHQRRSARWIARPIDIRTTIEYKTAKWLDAHMPGARVFAPGTIGFWLNAFSDAPQLTGGFDNGIRNPTVPPVIFHVYAGDKQQYMVNLLRAYGCDAMIGGGADSAEFYHPISHPEKLRGLTELWRDGGDAIYDIPRRSRSLAHVMRPLDLVRQPLSFQGFTALDPYLVALDNPHYPAASFRWRAPSAATVTADLQPDQILSVQIAWDQGWNASVDGRAVSISRDELGQMVVAPKCGGACTVELKYDGGTEGIYARAVDRLALAGGGLWILVTILWRKRSGLTKTN